MREEDEGLWAIGREILKVAQARESEFKANDLQHIQELVDAFEIGVALELPLGVYTAHAILPSKVDTEAILAWADEMRMSSSPFVTKFLEWARFAEDNR